MPFDYNHMAIYYNHLLFSCQDGRVVMEPNTMYRSVCKDVFLFTTDLITFEVGPSAGGEALLAAEALGL